MKLLIILAVLIALGVVGYVAWPTINITIDVLDPSVVKWRERIENEVSRWSASREPNPQWIWRKVDSYQFYRADNAVDSFYSPDSAWLLTVNGDRGWGYEWTGKQERAYGAVTYTHMKEITDTLTLNLIRDSLLCADTIHSSSH